MFVLIVEFLCWLNWVFVNFSLSSEINAEDGTFLDLWGGGLGIGLDCDVGCVKFVLAFERFMDFGEWRVKYSGLVYFVEHDGLRIRYYGFGICFVVANC